ncbi:MAG: DUF1622 domain-containing protein [Desulfobaccales bacterium]
MIPMAKGFEGFHQAIRWVAGGIEVLAVAIIVLGAIVTTIQFLLRLIKEGALEDCYRRFRSDFGKAILLGLEFLIASDIVGTVAVGPTFQDLWVLALLVAIRTFLSFALELEITGRWLWQRTGPGNGST